MVPSEVVAVVRETNRSAMLSQPIITSFCDLTIIIRYPLLGKCSCSICKLSVAFASEEAKAAKAYRSGVILSG
ncbi:hypothetical protein HC928_06575 [bacterium]|nr:hypothetical protein [bacterium]